MTRDEMILILRNNPKALEYIDGDGHTLYKPDALVAAGFPSSFIKEYTFVHKSDYSNPKYVIFGNDGNPVDEMSAVTALTLHYAVASSLDLAEGRDYESYGGRGSQARAIAEAIRETIKDV